MNSSNQKTNPMSAARTLLAWAFIFFVTPVCGQITIGGNVYGGGNNGVVGTASGDASGDATSVIIRGGDITGSVFGGGRMAGINGGTHVTLDGAKASEVITIGKVFGGNDVAGEVTFDAFVEATYAAGHKTIEVGELYGGGNGEYDYSDASSDAYGKSVPNLAKTKIKLLSGFYGKVFGGGNYATVTGSTTIELDNSTNAASGDASGDARAYQFQSVFGGNNNVAMVIRPTWDLKKGTVNNLYSGGNKGDMTHPQGILLAVKSADMTINNMFGGCRMSDVNPAKATFAAETLEGYLFPANYAARVLVTAGKINNVYGGNDVSGTVFGGNALEIRSSIIGDIYGGGNGSYNYTDNQTWVASHPEDADYYYSIPSGKTSAQALYSHRPNAESVNIHITGTQAAPTYVGGSLYCGGNSATLAKEGNPDGASANLTIGSYVIVKNAFLGSNGANIVTAETLQKYADASFSSLGLTTSANFEEYMRGCEVSIKPSVSFESGYIPYSTQFESMFCGGNVGSMSADGYFELSFLQKLVIYQKLVGGCNNADVAASAYNAAHKGGLTAYNPTKVIMNVAGVKFEPKSISYNSLAGTFNVTESTENGLLKGGNIYGGCYTSGYINGGVQMNITKDAISENVTANLDDHRDAVFNTALSAFGGGYGKDTEIKGNTVINISDEARIIKVFGGGEMGVVNGNTVINQTGGDIELIYGGGFEGLVKGNSTVNLDGGNIHYAFGGACNADIDGYAEMKIGVNGTPTVGDMLFGGNDFGGQIRSAGIHNGYGTDKVKSNTYVLFKKAVFENANGKIFGGSYGSYDYTASGDAYYAKASVPGFEFPSFTTAVSTASGDADIYVNGYVDIQPSAGIGGNIYGGGCGVVNAVGANGIGTANVQLPIVDMNSTYVLMHSGSDVKVAKEVYGGGYFSTVDYTRVDVYNGHADNVYGGTAGATASSLSQYVNYSCANTTVNLFTTGDNSGAMKVFGGGGMAGAGTTNVNLYGGDVAEVYGGSNMEGVVTTANISVPSTSTTVTGAVYGGGYGANDGLPCDVLTSNINWQSSTAYVTDGVIYGGNNSRRATKTSNVNISVPVRSSNGGDYISVCGGGNGANTITGYTNVNLTGTAHVKNVYGGGRDGKVLGYYDNKTGASEYYSNVNNPYANWAFATASGDAVWGTVSTTPNTNITISAGTTAYAVYGAGYGTDATVSGSTSVLLDGGTVTTDIFGGGYSGSLLSQGAANEDGNLYTYVNIHGGTVRTVYGGGFNGNVGNDTRNADTRVEIGTYGADVFAAGKPAIQQNVYGGGYKGAVIGTAQIEMNNGMVGYKYANSSYVENTSVNDNDNRLLESGNIFGGGFGEGATTDRTVVNMYEGTIRNSLYGGGEIASIGRADVNTIDVNDRSKIPDIIAAGSTQVSLYGGLVTNNVFGGGRGYSVDNSGAVGAGEHKYSDGYTFGKTLVNIHRGTVGTDASVKEGYGNVFGGGNVGYVYGADNSVSGSKKNVIKSNSDGYYHISDGGAMSEDCKVVVSPWARVVNGPVTLNGHTYQTGDLVPTEDVGVNTDWDSETGPFGDLDKQGVIIRNAVFAGGNVSAGSDKVYANAVTVYGNATASVIDCLRKDLITLGADEIGGLYGDGNLTFVDGYRELNITNYGTDYYGLGKELTLAEYMKLNSRERAYFELKYVCQQTYVDSDNKTHTKDDRITGSEYEKMSDTYKNESYWKLAGFCTLYAGRMMNTIQRADFCGVFGSRLVLKGALDRVPSVVDYTLYTINRIGELSLNQVHHGISALNGGSNGNYFGIYNVVNLLGALTSDVELSDVRTSESELYPADGSTYGAFKQANLNKRSRNNGTSKNMVALASGVWLEVVRGISETDQHIGNYDYKAGDKVYGPITGVVELDLLNAGTGAGGGYVYALNEHGAITNSSAGSQTTLTAANNGAFSYKQFEYGTMDGDTKMETSGNFVNGIKRIIDDCYPNNGAWMGENASPAHYWFVRGEYYVYDQYISAYTGAARSYAESVNVPLTITAEAQGRLKLLNVQENLNAYWTTAQYEALGDRYKVAGDTSCIVIDSKQYYRNTPISYWDYTRLTADERAFFTTATYVCNVAVENYSKGDVLTSTEYQKATDRLAGKYLVERDMETIGLNEGNIITQEQYAALDSKQKENCRLATTCFNVTNAVTSENGFLLTYDWDNPAVWDDWYIAPNGNDMVMKKNLTDNTYIAGPTYKCTNESAVFNIYGQTSYSAGDIISQSTYDLQPANASDHTSVTQAQFESAYVATDKCEFTIGGTDYSFVEGSTVSSTLYESMTTEQKAHFTPGYMCILTYQVSDNKYYISGDIISETEYNSIASAEQANFLPIYTCTASGAWGGKLFEGQQNYSALDVSNLSAAERANFQFNIDAFDVLIANSTSSDPDDIEDYTQPAGYTSLPNHGARHTNLYGALTSLDYTATYNGDTPLTLNGGTTVDIIGGATGATSVSDGNRITNQDFENLVNERANYSAFTAYASKYVVQPGETITSANGTVYSAGMSISAAVYNALTDAQKAKVAIQSEDCDYYLVNTEFWIGDTWYGVGKALTTEEYNSLDATTQTNSVTRIDGSAIRSAMGSAESAQFYFCKNKYTSVSSGVNGIALSGSTPTYQAGSEVPVGTVLNRSTYTALINDQANFEIDGTVPTETSTLYVSRETDINSINEDRICTVIYEYNYIESNDDGTGYENVKERHIINIHLQFRSGVPSVGDLNEPDAVIPGTAVGLNQPSVTTGAYEILGGGWELYANEEDAQSHRNGMDFENNLTKVYWYEDGYQLAYYAKSYLGKTYSNPVRLTVANYHRMANVMNSTHTVASGDAPINDYMYINEAAENPNLRDAKVYIKDASELDNFAQFIAKTFSPSANDDLTDIVKGGNRIDFIIDGDIDHSGSTWTSIASDNNANCFAGVLHGDGHTISGMSSSLFDHLCGDVYNLGVTGSFTGGGVAETGAGYVENCWVATTGTPTGRAVYNNPSDPDMPGRIQLVNSYYPETNAFASGDAKPMPVSAFLNGEVAYDLNGFYLKKRYYDHDNVTSGAAGYAEYSYYTVDDRETADLSSLTTEYYPNDYYQYVENRYGNEDFIYSNGIIPTKDNIRKTMGRYYPVYPDDYIFFGQKLTFDNAKGYQAKPSTIVKETTLDRNEDDFRLTKSDATGNRVYRAPAYYSSDDMNDIHFNSSAVFAAAYTTASGDAVWGSNTAYNVHKGLTAVDFTGYNDVYTASGDAKSYGDGNGELFFTPLLDYVGLNSIKTTGITRNLLAYIPAAGTDPTTAEYKTNTNISAYFYEPDFVIGNADYNNVEIAENSENVHGHVIQKNGEFVAHDNHFLVDGEDFNAPIAYTFDTDKRMWYQRTPTNFVSTGADAWETIVLPFTAKMVSAHEKGEISHFYEGSSIGHEYWLRDFTGFTQDKNKNVIAEFKSPAAGTEKYEYTNQFLWENYFSKSSQKDANGDEYQEYYDDLTDLEYDDYGFLQCGVPYIVAFPGSYYYEFDMSGTFEPQHTDPTATFPTLHRQTITYASDPKAEIEVTDLMDGALTTTHSTGTNPNKKDVSFRGTFLSENVASGDAYKINGSGTEFDLSQAFTTVPFRAYFKVKLSDNQGAPMRGTKSSVIYIGNGDHENIGNPDLMNDGRGLKITSDNMTIYIESSLNETVLLNVVNGAGKLIKVVAVLPGAKAEVPVNNRGIYLVNKTKVAVTR